MRKLLTLALILLCPALALAGGGFLAGLEDVPLPPSLTETPGSGMVFDSPTGRIVEAVATGQAQADQIRAFYEQTLPQLGWLMTGDLQFRRDNELLRIVIDTAPKALTVHFTLTPNR